MCFIRNVEFFGIKTTVYVFMRPSGYVDMLADGKFNVFRLDQHVICLVFFV